MGHVGIDVHKRESQIYILAQGGEVIEASIRIRARGREPSTAAKRSGAVRMRCSTESEWVARCLKALGHEVVVADPNFAPMYATRSSKVKTDRRDARALAEACCWHERGDRLRRVLVLPILGVEPRQNGGY
jgi:transposase